MALKITRPQGTEDITPENISKWYTVEQVARDTAKCFGFHEMRIPTFESTDLFLRSVGETTDVVQKEMYTVKAKETEFTLRPEGTAGTIRSMLQNGMLNAALPQKVFSYAAASCKPVFRFPRKISQTLLVLPLVSEVPDYRRPGQNTHYLFHTAL